MARKLRVEYPGAVYHVINRGDRREAIFRDDEDRQRFIGALGEACAKTGWQVHALGLMPNHFHLVVETPPGQPRGGNEMVPGRVHRTNQPAAQALWLPLQPPLRVADSGWRRKAVFLVAFCENPPAPVRMKRCSWAQDDLSIAYHDTEWGVPVHDDRLLFEMLILEGAQAGLSWITILKKRENYRRAFDRFDAAKIAKYDARKVAKLMADPGIVRNRLKIESTIRNARAFLDVQKEFGSFDAYIWKFVGGTPIQNRRKSFKEVPAKTPESDAMSKDLLKRGFKFVGSTICYAFMQAVGMVNDHTIDCSRHAQLQSRR
jgi:DNA-3-methyladenine glycosylase I